MNWGEWYNWQLGCHHPVVNERLGARANMRESMVLATMVSVPIWHREKAVNGMCEKCNEYEEKMEAIANESDDAFAHGTGPGSWLSWEPVISDNQLSVFERMLTLTMERMKDTGNGPRAFVMDTAANMMVPANVVLVMMRELQLHRSGATSITKDTLTVSDVVGSRSFLGIERHGKDGHDTGKDS